MESLLTNHHYLQHPYMHNKKPSHVIFWTTLKPTMSVESLKHTRIACLIPSATDICVALDLGRALDIDKDICWLMYKKIWGGKSWLGFGRQMLCVCVFFVQGYYKMVGRILSIVGDYNPIITAIFILWKMWSQIFPKQATIIQGISFTHMGVLENMLLCFLVVRKIDFSIAKTLSSLGCRFLL